jgi:hypothetical protein
MEGLRRLFILQPQRGGRDRSTDIVLGEILREVRELRKEIKRMQQQIQDAFATLQDEVNSVRDTEQAALTLINGLQTQLNQALNSGGDPSEIVAAVQGITNQLSSDAAGLASAVVTPPSTGGSDTSSSSSGADTGNSGSSSSDGTSSSSDSTSADTSTSTTDSGSADSGDAADPTAGQ